MFNWSGRFAQMESIIVGTDAWQSWVGSADDTVLRSRVTWPVRAANLTDYPFINFDTGVARTKNITGGIESSANFQPLGTFMFRLWDADSDPDDPQVSFDAFDVLYTALWDDIVAAATSTGLILNGFESDEPAIVHSGDSAFIKGDGEVSDGVWCTGMHVGWGIA